MAFRLPTSYGTIVSVNNPDSFQCKLCNSVFYVQTLFTYEIIIHVSGYYD